MQNFEAQAAALFDLKPSTKMVALMLAARMNDNHEGWEGRPIAWPDFNTLERDTGLKRRSINYCINELVEAGVIRVYKERSAGCRWTHNVYEWTATSSPNYRPDWKRSPATKTSHPGTRMTDQGWRYCEDNGVGPIAAAEEHPEFLSDENPEAEEVSEPTLDIAPAPTTQHAPKKAPESLTDGFDKWWAAYPRKTAKKAAQKAYKAAIKDGATPTRLIAALNNHIAAWRAENREARYIPYPSTWLNSGNWEDETPTSPANTTPAYINNTVTHTPQPVNPTTYDFTDIINRLDNGDYGPAN